jgi:phospholipase/carboxylesterase
MTSALPVGPLLRAIDGLEHVARGLRPGALSMLLSEIGEPDGALAAALEADPPTAPRDAAIRSLLDEGGAHALQALARLRASAGVGDELPRAYRALRGLSGCLERIYPLAGLLETVNQHFLEPPARGDPARRLPAIAAAPPDGTGVMQFGDERGGFWLYVPEDDPTGPLPLVMALHGGSGSGRQYLWRWLRTARSRRLIVVAPTALGDTWAITEPDEDSANLAGILAQVSGRWPIDDRRLLLTGLSDGGTFTYVSGLQADSPFTHLAPFGANFVTMLAAFAEPRRLRGLPIHIVHGALDWMFPPFVAHEAAAALGAAGASVRYTEIGDASHVHPAEINARIIDWMCEGGADHG